MDKRQSLKSARGRNPTQEQSGGAVSAFTAEPKVAAVAPVTEAKITVWKCEKCLRPNDFASGGLCGKLGCNGNIQTQENFDMQDMTYS